MPQSQLSPAVLAMIQQRMAQEPFLRNLQPTGGQGTQENPYTFPTINVAGERPPGPGMQNAQVRPGGTPNIQTDTPRTQESQIQAAAATGGEDGLKALIPLLGIGLVTAALTQIHGKGKKKAPRTSFAGSLAGGTGYEELAQEPPTFLEALAPAIGVGLTTYAQGKLAESQQKKATVEKTTESGREALVNLVGKGVLPPEELGKRWSSGSLEGLTSPTGPQALPAQLLKTVWKDLPASAKTRFLQDRNMLSPNEIAGSDPQSAALFATSLLGKSRPAWLSGDTLEIAGQVLDGKADPSSLYDLYDRDFQAERTRLEKKSARRAGTAGGFNYNPSNARLQVVTTGHPIPELFGFPGFHENDQQALIESTKGLREFTQSKSIAGTGLQLLYSGEPAFEELGRGMVSRGTAGMTRGQPAASTPTETATPTGGPTVSDAVTDLRANAVAYRGVPRDMIEGELRNAGIDPVDPAVKTALDEVYGK